MYKCKDDLWPLFSAAALLVLSVDRGYQAFSWVTQGLQFGCKPDVSYSKCQTQSWQ